MPHPSVTAVTYPHKPAVIMGESGESVSYSALDEQSNRGAHLLRAMGLKAGDHIAMLLENNRQFFEIVYAAQRSGIIFTPVSTHLKQEEITYILGNCGAKLFVCSHLFEDVARKVRGRVPGVEQYYMVGGIAEGYSSWEEGIDLMPTTPIDDERLGAAMLYSSGTTGQPKGVFVPPISEDIHTTHPLAESLGSAFGFSEETVYLSPAPLYHAAPLHFCMMALSQGATLVIMERFDAETALRLIQDHRVTHSQWVPIMFSRMLKLPAEVREKYDVSSLQCAIHAAAPCPVEIKQDMIDWWGPVLVEYYAASESIGVTIIDSASWLSHKGSVGRSVVGDLHIVDEEGNELPAGEVGLVYFSGEQATFSYHGEPEKTREAYHPKGWATTGDIGYVDEEGYLYLTDRKHFTIISGGVNIYPQEIENLLITHPKVADVAVFGVPNEEFGEEVKAVVEPAHWGDATDEVAIELLEWLRERLSNIKLPRTLDFREQLPRLDNGKLYKRHLVDEYRDKPD